MCSVFLSLNKRHKLEKALLFRGLKTACAITTDIAGPAVGSILGHFVLEIVREVLFCF